ncbi:hypothetical protein EOI86_02555 [Hwanghaeella grinnelliae]|uniref:Uncharacterized protein n=2 Tax=Hwanghaeella grinnelliae TaxID=2500179 RepID=A0A437QYZ1_9PROT|nr:hypothetical protein EOI86_02555 [Hwanghaeella grinnelliae]
MGLATAMAASTAQAADFSDPDWPCIQRKVPHLSIGQMWAGPVIDDALQKSWRDNDEIHRLASVLSLRRTPLEKTDEMIANFAERDDIGKDKADRLTTLFAGIFTLIDKERTEIIAGIARYAHKQDELADRIDTRRDTLQELSEATEPDYDRIEELQDQITWDSRIFKDRAQSLTYVCETPVILEKRAFTLARSIQQRLP